MTLRQWAVVITVAIAAMLEVVDVSIANVALPHIQANLGATVAEAGWVVTGYAMASVVMIPLSEWLSEQFGQRSYFVFCLIGFTGASVLCGLSSGLPTLVMARIAQGLLGGGLMLKAQAILFQVVPKAKQGIAQGVFGIGVLVGPVIGPTLGGYLTDGLSWRWIFFINVPIGVLTLLMALAFLPADADAAWADSQGQPLTRRNRSVDWTGIVLLVAGLASLQVVLEQGHQLDWFDNAGIRQLAVLTAVALPAFIWWELRTPAPAVDLTVLRHRSLAAGSLFSMVLGMGLYGTVFVVPIFAQSVLHYTATQTGLLMLPGALASAFTMGVLGKNAQRVDPRLLIAIGAAAMVITMLKLAQLSANTNDQSLFWPLIFRGVTTVTMFLPLSLATLGPLPREDVGAGSGFYNLTRQLGGSFGIAILTLVLDHQQDVHRAQLLLHLNGTNPILQQRLEAMTRWMGGRGDQALQLLSQQVDQQAALLAYADVFRLVAIVFLAALPLVLLLGKPAQPQPSS